MRVSGLIREALQEKYARKKRNVELLKSIGGIWADRDFDIEKYVRNLRDDNRLKRVYAK
jgi:predicted CopG family antitoxin